MHKKIRFPGRMIVDQTISKKDGFTSMITKFDENQSILQILFAYVDSLTIGGVTPVTGRPTICRKVLLKYFFKLCNKTVQTVHRKYYLYNHVS